MRLFNQKSANLSLRDVKAARKVINFVMVQVLNKSSTHSLAMHLSTNVGVCVSLCMYTKNFFAQFFLRQGWNEAPLEFYGVPSEDEAEETQAVMNEKYEGPSGGQSGE